MPPAAFALQASRGRRSVRDATPTDASEPALDPASQLASRRNGVTVGRYTPVLERAQAPEMTANPGGPTTTSTLRATGTAVSVRFPAPGKEAGPDH